MELIIIFFLTLVALGNAFIHIDVNLPNPAIDTNLHNEVLDTERCEEHINFLRSNLLAYLQYSDAGLRLPRGITTFNFQDLGHYHNCLRLRHNTGDDIVEGKYCRINIPLSQNFTLPFQSTSRHFNLADLDEILPLDDDTIAIAEESYLRRAQMLTLLGIDEGLITEISPILQMISLDLAMCIPRSCSTQQAMESLIFNTSTIGFTFTEETCRLPDDKPWSPADTVATVVFSIIGVLTILSTGYDLTNTFWLKNDPKTLNPLYASFSVYTNGRRLNTFSTAPGILRSLDGIRALAMAWVLVGHAFGTESTVSNPRDALEWLLSTKSVWVSAGVYTVDTFFCLAGVVLVYTTASKMSKGQLLKNLPLFYLNRLLRLWPILALGILLQVSYFNRMGDGPIWYYVELGTNWCRQTWYLPLLMVQNYINTDEMCLPHSWYVAIDFHCYLVSPLILYWVLGRNKKAAWIALTAALLAILAAATAYNFVMEFDSNIQQFDRADNYMSHYYKNTLTRASPFFVGMIAGYVLHLYRGRKLGISWITAIILWIIAASVSTTVFFYPAISLDEDWDYPFVDGLMNSFMRPAWGAAICWLIVACEHGYGGPVNWFLCLDVWRLPARLAYAVYVLHYPLMFAFNAALTLQPVYFTVASFTFKCLAHTVVSLAVAYVATLIIDAPCSTLCKLLLEGNKKKPTLRKETKNEELEVASSDKDTDIISKPNGTDNDK